MPATVSERQVDILAALQSEMENLSRSEVRIAELLFADTEFAVNSSIIELAARAEVSPPTVTRFCRRLGCASYSEFKVKLAQTTYVGSRYLQPDSRDMGTAEIAENIVNRAQTALYQMHQALDLAALDKVADRLSQADMIYAFGSGGNSSMIADEIQNRLFRLGLRVTTSADHEMQLMMAASAKSPDVIIASSISGRNMPLVKALEAASDYKVFSVALTRTGSPLSQAASITLPIDLPEGVNIYKPTAARFAYLALIDIVATMVALRLKDSATETLRRIKHQMVTHRDEDDKDALGD